MILAAYAVPHPPIIVPEIGKGEEKKIARTSAAYDAVMAEAAALHADTLVITSPHADAYVDYFAISPGTEAEGSFGQFGAPQVRIKVSYDKALAAMPLKVPFGTGTACLFLKRRILSPYSPWIPLFQGKPPNAGSTLFGSWQAPWMALPFPRRATPTRTFLVSATAL